MFSAVRQLLSKIIRRCHILWLAGHGGAASHRTLKRATAVFVGLGVRLEPRGFKWGPGGPPGGVPKQFSKRVSDRGPKISKKTEPCADPKQYPEVAVAADPATLRPEAGSGKGSQKGAGKGMRMGLATHAPKEARAPDLEANSLTL